MTSTLIGDAIVNATPYAKVFMALAFALIWAALIGQAASKLGRAINWLFLGLVGLAAFNAYLVGYLSELRFLGTVSGPTEWVIAVGANLMPIMVAALGLRVGYLIHHADTYEISEAGIWDALTRAMPIIVADGKGLIQYTTPAFDELANAAPGELVGRDLKTIMPERYRHRHDAGMRHYGETRQPRIVGSVVVVEMQRMDGTEVPVYLALNTADVDGEPWYIAALWEKPPADPDTVISEHEHARRAEHDRREAVLDETGRMQAETGRVNAERGQHLSEQGEHLADGFDDLDRARRAFHDERATGIDKGT